MERKWWGKENGKKWRGKDNGRTKIEVKGEWRRKKMEEKVEQR